jgi:hypothetical protein
MKKQLSETASIFLNLIESNSNGATLGTVVEETREGPEYIVSDADPETVADRMVKHGGFMRVGEADDSVFVVNGGTYELWYKRPWTAEDHPFDPYDEYRGFVKLSPVTDWDEEDIEDLPRLRLVDLSGLP